MYTYSSRGNCGISDYVHKNKNQQNRFSPGNLSNPQEWCLIGWSKPSSSAFRGWGTTDAHRRNTGLPIGRFPAFSIPVGWLF